MRWHSAAFEDVVRARFHTNEERKRRVVNMSIVDSIMNLLPWQVTSSLADRLGASPSAVQTGIGTSVAALLAGFANHAGDPTFVTQVFNLVKTTNTQNILDTLPKLASGAAASSPATDPGWKLSSLLLHGQQSQIENFIGRQSGLTADAGRELMALAAPLTAGFLGQQIRDTGLTLSEFAGMIRSEASKIQHVLPAGLPNLLSAASIPAALRTTEATAGGSPGKKVAYTLIGLLLLALIAWLVSRGCRESEPAPATPAETASPAPSPSAALALGAFIQRKLPDGTVLNIPSMGIENRLLDFIEDHSLPVDKTTWFDFDRLTFDTGKATLQDSSTEQLQNIAAILKAYPNVKAKIGGYTDNTGNKDANLKLSQDRAVNVTHELVQRGVDPSHLEAEGYGEEHPVADNATPEGRQKNRRISLRVTAK
jgi:outer membrane protein OmpA-like peptidoglycan-associated protein